MGNEVVSKHYKSAAEISDLGKVQIARACGVAIVTNGNMYPTMELLLRHAIQYLGIAGKKLVTEPGVLDNVEEFLRDMAEVWEGNASDADLQEKMTPGPEMHPVNPAAGAPPRWQNGRAGAGAVQAGVRR